MVGESPTVWLYWDSPESGDPGYIELCIRSIRKWAGRFDVVVLSSDSIRNWVPDIHPVFSDIPVIAHRADYARAATLAVNGGIWLDIDTVVVSPIQLLWELTALNGAVFYGWRSKEPSIGMIAARAGHPMIVAWRQAIERRISESVEQRWAGFGYDLLWPIAAYSAFCQVPREQCAPTHWTETGLFGRRMGAEKIVDDATMMVQLYNRGLSEKMGAMSASEICSSGTLLASLFELSEERLFNGAVVDRIVEDIRLSVAAAQDIGGGSTDRWLDVRHLSMQMVRSYWRALED
ncbi:capsular polysaccharide synthesis protein [Actinomyces ruminicola]|uniref:capsular polysaccharide synthesis protein n=1 Tax=Actinomyces ruminicola TaxID=332524 RepID=UPI000B83D8BD|nr:capsular polysaccharide synthesis protein [Actinomyces ruminicola]